MSTSAYKYTIGSTGNQKTFTLSGWFKICGILDTAADGCFFSYYSTATNNPRSEIVVNNDLKIYVGINPSGLTWKTLIFPNRLRDPAAWYHMVFTYDTTESVEADRVKVYVNGNQITPDSGDYPSLNEDTGYFVSGDTMNIGKDGAAVYWSGNMAHVNITEGTAYAPTAFGEFDSTSGIWIPKSGPSVTYGDEGGFYKFDADALTTDSSGSGNTLTSIGTPTPTKDNPENNFCTMNPLSNFDQNQTFSQGNNTIVSDVAAPAVATMGVETGKWYWECKAVASSGTDFLTGVRSTQVMDSNAENGYRANDWSYYGPTGNYLNNNTDTSYGDSYTVGDIIGVALDVTNSKLYFSKGGVWQNSGVPTSGGTGTGAISITAVGSTPLGLYTPAAGGWSSSVDYTWSFNFGNGYFGTTVVSSSESDDNGEGSFEYDVPAGYYALCSNNLGSES